MRICIQARMGEEASAAINGWLWRRLLPDLKALRPGALLLGAGPGLSAGVEEMEGHPRIIVFGAGARGAGCLPDLKRPCFDLRFVRGPETAALFGLPTEKWLADPAIMAPRIAPRCELPSRGDKPIAFMPGGLVSTTEAERIAAESGLVLIRPERETGDAWLKQLMRCGTAVVADPSAAAAADAYGIPWRPLCVGEGPEGERRRGLSFQWRDWTRAMGLSPEPVTIPGGVTRRSHSFGGLLGGIVRRKTAAALERLREDDLWSLSDRTLLRLRQQALYEQWEALKQELAPCRRGLRVVAAE